VKYLRLLNPFRIRNVVRRIRESTSGGGPAAVRLTGISHPKGWIVPRARVSLEVVARDGTVTRFEPDVPIPFPYAWAYRIARRLHVPLISGLDPERFEAEVPIPGGS
jgi:hypothetical protein